MKQEESLQHFQLPNKMGEYDVEPKDQLIYIAIKFFDGKGGCFPSLQKIADKAGTSIPTVRASIQRLKDKKYIEVKPKGRGQEYIFNEHKKFEPFSPEFLDNKNISFTTKAYIAASQQYMYTEIKGIGKMSYTNRELSNKICMSESTIRRCNNELTNKNLLKTIDNENRDLETGCKTKTKIFNLKDIGQTIIWTLKEHSEQLKLQKLQIEQNSEDINTLKENYNELLERVQKLEKEKRSENQLVDKIFKNENDKSIEYTY